MLIPQDHGPIPRKKRGLEYGNREESFFPVYMLRSNGMSVTGGVEKLVKIVQLVRWLVKQMMARTTGIENNMHDPKRGSWNWLLGISVCDCSAAARDLLNSDTNTWWNVTTYSKTRHGTSQP